MANTEYERVYVSKMYPTRSWLQKVNRMSDYQVHAIYMRDQEKQQKMKSLKQCPKCGKAGGLIYCPVCHGAQQELPISDKEK